MEILSYLIIGLGVGALLTSVYIKKETTRKNREKWRKYSAVAAAKKAKRGR